MYDEFEFNIMETKEEVFEHFWENVNLNRSKLDEPPVEWKPQNRKLRLWNGSYRIMKLSNGDEIICKLHNTENGYFKVGYPMKMCTVNTMGKDGKYEENLALRKWHIY